MRSTVARGAIAAALLGLVVAGDATATPPPAFGEARILAQVPNPPGFPEGIAVRGNHIYVAGPATFGTTGKPASAVLAFDRKTGALLERYDVVGEDVFAEHANSSIAFGADDQLYVLNTQLGM